VVKTEFSIKDLENLSEVKAHTIRIWEKRYNLLEPNRTDTNIRRYDMENLKKLLNITYLYKEGYKISKLAQMSPLQIQGLIQKDMDTHNSTWAIESLKETMMSFNNEQFDSLMETLLRKKNFSDIYAEVFIPLLNSAGTLWHTGTVDPTHEHFISEKIKHLLVSQTSEIKKQVQKVSSPEYVLFLPNGEMHEISLLYANYELIANGYGTLYLGPNIPIAGLKYVLKQKPKTTFISCFTVHPKMENLESYLTEFEEEIGTKNQLWVLGKQPEKFSSNRKYIKYFPEPNSFKEQILKNS